MLVCRNQQGRDRVLILQIAADGSAKLMSPADGPLRISQVEMARFAEELDLTMSSIDYPGGFKELTPTMLVEPLEPVMLADIGPLDKERRAILKQADLMICQMYARRRDDADSEQVAIELGRVRRWLYREAPTAFWISCEAQSLDTILSHAVSHASW